MDGTASRNNPRQLSGPGEPFESSPRLRTVRRLRRRAEFRTRRRSRRGATLYRSRDDSYQCAKSRMRRDADNPARDHLAFRDDAGGSRSRSEEHTSELQSHLNLVCRLLLEKKKNTKHTTV